MVIFSENQFTVITEFLLTLDGVRVLSQAEDSSTVESTWHVQEEQTSMLQWKEQSCSRGTATFTETTL